MNVGQAGRPVVLCGTVEPGSLEGLTEARYFAAIHYLALVCSDEELGRRLRARPAWRHSHAEDFVARMLAFNRSLRTGSSVLIDTTGSSVEETSGRVAAWVRSRSAE
jgi:hypothetical protein